MEVTANSNSLDGVNELTNENIRQFEALFNYATIGIILVNDKGEIINFNKCAETQFGYKKEEVYGHQIELLIPHRYHFNHLGNRKYFYHNPRPRIMGEGRNLCARKKDGTEFLVEVSLSSYTCNGHTYVIAFVIDITLRKHHEALVYHQNIELERFSREVKEVNIALEQKVEGRTKMLKNTLAELEKSRQELSSALKREKEMGELKSAFVTIASHEFRTPLSTILSSAYLLSKYNECDEPDKRKKHIKRIKEAVAGMKNILEDFLSLGKLEEGSIQANIETLSAKQYLKIITDTIQEMRQMAKPGQSIKLAHTGQGKVRVDGVLLKNILINLISNAIKFSPKDTLIDVVCKVTDTDLMILVKDRGIGIAENEQQHLFKRFFRAENAVNIQGTGLGLHIIAKYADLMKGCVDLQSKLNEGTTVTIYIPQNR